MSGLAIQTGLAIVAVCPVCGEYTGISCGGYDNNEYIAQWIERGDRIDAVTIEAVREGSLCRCSRAVTPERVEAS